MRLDSFVWLVVLAHTLHLLYVLRTQPPPNLFTALKIPVNTATDVIQALLQRSADAPLPQPISRLLDRLSSFEMRALYVRCVVHDAILAALISD